jgi:hypothetical protein
MRCKTKQEEDSRSANTSKKFGADLRVSSHQITVAAAYDRRILIGVRRNPGEINDRPG